MKSLNKILLITIASVGFLFVFSYEAQAETYNDRFAMAITSNDENNNVVCTVIVPKGSVGEADEICDGILNT